MPCIMPQMKLLVVASEYPPHGSGIANVVDNLVKKLREKGVECTVCTPHGPDIQLGSWILIQKTGIIGLIYFWYKVTHFLSGKEYDLVWLHNPFIIWSNPFRNCVVTMHSTYHGESKQIKGTPFFLRMYRYLARIIEQYCLTRLKGSFFTGVSPSVCMEIEEIGISREIIKFISNGVNTQRFRPRENKYMLRNKFGIPQNSKIILSVGRLTYHKQPFTLLRVFSQLSQRMDNIILCFAGGGELSGTLKNYVKKNKLKGVIFLGHLNHEKVLPDLYASSDFFIMTSSYEGVPLTLLEAMASGLPCIVSDLPNFHIIEEAECGLIVDFGDPESVNKIFHYINSNQQLYSSNAREFAIKNLDWKIVAEKYLELFQFRLNKYDD